MSPTFIPVLGVILASFFLPIILYSIAFCMLLLINGKQDGNFSKATLYLFYIYLSEFLQHDRCSMLCSV